MSPEDLTLLSAAANMDNVFEYKNPNYNLIFSPEQSMCEAQCTNFLYYCKHIPEGYFCEMNSTKLAIVVFFAVLTGVLVPLTCIGMYVCGIWSLICRKIRPGSYDDKALMERKEWDTYHSSDSEGRSRFGEFPQSSTAQTFNHQSAFTITPSESAMSADLLLVPTSSSIKKSDSQINYA